MQNLRFFEKLFHNQCRDGFILFKFDIGVVFGVVDDEFEGLIDDKEEILVVDVVINNVFVHAVDDGFDNRFEVFAISTQLVSSDQSQHQLRVFRQ